MVKEEDDDEKKKVVGFVNMPTFIDGDTLSSEQNSNMERRVKKSFDTHDFL